MLAIFEKRFNARRSPAAAQGRISGRRVQRLIGVGPQLIFLAKIETAPSVNAGLPDQSSTKG